MEKDKVVEEKCKMFDTLNAHHANQPGSSFIFLMIANNHGCHGECGELEPSPPQW